MRRAIFIRTDRLGETLLNLPAIAALKAALPSASVTVLVQPALASLMARAPGVDEVWAERWHRGPWWLEAAALARRLRAGRFELAVVSNPKKALHAAAWLGGARWRAGYDRKWGGLLTHRIADRKAIGERHEVDYNLDLLRALGLPVTVSSVRLRIDERDDRAILQRLNRSAGADEPPIVAVHPWTSNPAKQWPEARFRELIARVAAGLGATVAVVGGEEERCRITGVLPGGAQAVDLVGRLTLPQSAALFARSRVVVSSDSGPVHLAAAVGARTVVLFGGGDPAAGPRRWGPWGEGHCVIARSAVDQIGVDEVLERVAQTLGRPAGPGE